MGVWWNDANRRQMVKRGGGECEKWKAMTHRLDVVQIDSKLPMLPVKIDMRVFRALVHKSEILTSQHTVKRWAILLMEHACSLYEFELSSDVQPPLSIA